MGEYEGLVNNFVHMYAEEVTSKIVAESGIPTDRFHIGKIVLKTLQDDPNFVMQIDGSTGESETNGSALERCIRCAVSLTRRGVSRGDVVVLMAPNHLHLAVPFYAALFLGVTIAPVDRLLSVHELKYFFEVLKPKAIFCQSEKVADIEEALQILQLSSLIVSFDESSEVLSLSKLLGECPETDIRSFRAVDFNAEETTAFLGATSGSTGLPKFVIITHKYMMVGSVYIWCTHTKFPSPVDSILIVSPLQVITSIMNYFLATFLKYTRIQTPLQYTPEHTIDVIKKFKPGLLILNPILMTALVKTAVKMNCDFSSFDTMFLGGCAVSEELLAEIKKLNPRIKLANMFGMTELAACAFSPAVRAPPGSMGKPIGFLQYQLVDINTGDIIRKPNQPGELWLRNYAGFKGYYNNPEATVQAVTSDGWFKTGDMMYRDENWNFYFVERIKLLLQYKNNKISPVEIESVIRQHPAVLEAAVGGSPHADYGDLPVAFVIPRPGYTLTEQDIHSLVKEKLTDTKQLRGGIIFLRELPLTSTGKINRPKLKELVVSHVNGKQIIK